MVGGDELVAVGGRFAEARANDDQQIGIADALLELGVGAVAELAGIDAAGVGDGVLAAEGGGGGDAVAEGEIGPMMRGARAPVGAADDRDGGGGVLEQVDHRADRAGVGGFGDRGTRGRSSASTSSRSMSSGMARTTGPGRPAVATR